jgi:hypothetical protein
VLQPVCFGCHIVSAERSITSVFGRRFLRVPDLRGSAGLTATPERRWSGSPTPPNGDVLALRIMSNVSNSVPPDAVSDEATEEDHECVAVLYALTEGKKIASCGRDGRYGGVP